MSIRKALSKSRRGINKPLDLFNKQFKVGRVTQKVRNTIELLREKYERDIEIKSRELELLKAKLSHLIEFSHDAEKLNNPDAEPDKYKDVGATVAILDALSEVCKNRKCDDRGATAANVRDYLLAHGFEPRTSGNTFNIAISVTLQRLAEQRRIKSVLDDGRRFYKPKEI